MKTIFTVGAVVLATCLLSGCVNEQKVNQLASNVQTMLPNPKLTEPIRVLMLRTILIACAACVCTQNDKKIPGSVSVAGDIF